MDLMCSRSGSNVFQPELHRCEEDHVGKDDGKGITDHDVIQIQAKHDASRQKTGTYRRQEDQRHVEAQGMPALEALGKFDFVADEVFHLLPAELRTPDLALMGPVVPLVEHSFCTISF